MKLLKVKRHFQITLPVPLRKKYRLTVGDYIEVEDRDGSILLKPVKVIHPDQEYFYTKEWQQEEVEADRDIDEGNLLGPFEDANDAIEALKTAKE